MILIRAVLYVCNSLLKMKTWCETDQGESDMGAYAKKDRKKGYEKERNGTKWEGEKKRLESGFSHYRNQQTDSIKHGTIAGCQSVKAATVHTYLDTYLLGIRYSKPSPDSPRPTPAFLSFAHLHFPCTE